MYETFSQVHHLPLSKDLANKLLFEIHWFEYGAMLQLYSVHPIHHFILLTLFRLKFASNAKVTVSCQFQFALRNSLKFDFKYWVGIMSTNIKEFTVNDKDSHWSDSGPKSMQQAEDWSGLMCYDWRGATLGPTQLPPFISTTSTSSSPPYQPLPTPPHLHQKWWYSVLSSWTLCVLIGDLGAC